MKLKNGLDVRSELAHIQCLHGKAQAYAAALGGIASPLG
jgi:hypothetical protein